MLEVGAKAPEFTLDDQDGETVSLAALRGTPVVLYFYPKDDTPGCTTQACGIRDQWADFSEAGAHVFGVSPDDVDSHKKFQQKFDLPHRLLADPDRVTIDSYEVWGLKKMYGKEYYGVLRTTYLIDADGIIANVWTDVKPKEHADDVLAAINALAA